jgi:hypothetical protein
LAEIDFESVPLPAVVGFSEARNPATDATNEGPAGSNVVECVGCYRADHSMHNEDRQQDKKQTLHALSCMPCHFTKQRSALRMHAPRLRVKS